MKVLFFLSLISLVYAHGLLPSKKNCDPRKGDCQHGDFVATDIADCEYDRDLFHMISCDAENDHMTEWTVDVARGHRCKSIRNRPIRCGAPGTKTRCVCSDVKYGDGFNECRCQYVKWHDEL